MSEWLRSESIDVAVDVLPMTVRGARLQVLLSRRTSEPHAARWALPGCALRIDESADGAVRQLLDEFLPVGEVYREQLYTFTEVNRDPRGRVISIAYLAAVPPRQAEAALKRRGGSLRCFDVRLREGELTLTGEGETLRGGDLAFDHGQIIETGVARLRGKIDYTDIGFRFLDDDQAFSMRALTEIFRAALDRPIDESNFRRTIKNRYLDAGRIEPTDLSRAEGRRGRPAALYRWIG